MSNTDIYDLPVVITAAGAQPTPPATIQLTIITGVTSTNPDYTANLPGSLIEDVLDTEVFGISLIDQARVETINSLTPYGANDFLLIQLGNMAGISQAGQTNTSVYCVFSGSPNFVIVQGFVVSDGPYQYTVQDGGIIGTGGSSLPLFCVATQTGSWPVPSGTVTETLTSVPTGITCTVNNPTAGTAGGAAQTSVSFRQAALQANLAATQGMATFLKTQLAQVPGVQARLVSVQQQTGGGWEVICGGGDPNQVGYAIYDALFDISILKGSVLNITAIGAAYPALITTDKNHGYATGQIVIPQGIVGTGNLTNMNNTPYTATVVSETTFTVAFTPSGGASYTGSGIIIPNLRNITAAINDYPDVYSVVFVNPPPLTVAMTVTWNTISTSFVSASAIAQLAGPAIANYVNNVQVGSPLNLLDMEAAFIQSISGVLPSSLVSELEFSVSVNGIGASFTGNLLFGEPNSSVQESYFTTNTGLITIVQG
jgi:hypothetical protein